MPIRVAACLTASVMRSRLRTRRAARAGLVEDSGRWGDARGKPTSAHGLIRVITAQREAVEKLQQRSRLDSATGALNRAGLTAQIVQLWRAPAHHTKTTKTETEDLLTQHATTD